jgi:hypothetical protein
VIELALDNDVIIKTSSYLNGEHLLHHCCDQDCGGENVVLATAQWVCAKHLRDRVSVGTAPPASIDYLQGLLAALSPVEPTEDEILFAAVVEEVAQRNGLELDTGEAILAAICATRSGVLVTGDKRAVRALELALLEAPGLAVLQERVACLEQAIATISIHTGGPQARAQVCAAPRADVALSAAMECARPAGYFSLDGIRSYVESLRRDAPTILHPGVSLCGSLASVA